MIYDDMICLFMDNVLGILLMRIPAVSIGGIACPDGFVCYQEVGSNNEQ